MLASTPHLKFRGLEASDEPFRLELFVTSREREFSALPEVMQHMLVAQQYAGYISGMATTYPDARHLVFSLPQASETDRAAGIVSITDLGDHLQVIDLAVHPVFRNRGTGSLVLETVMEHCRSTGQIMRGSVTPYNPARRLYARLGIRELDAEHGYIRLEWRPDEVSRNAAVCPSAGNVQEDEGRASRDALQFRLKNS